MILPNFNSNYHPEWQLSRIHFMSKILPHDFFQNKRVLELGSFNGYIGNFCYINGATVTCIEGRIENANNIRSTFPNLSVLCDNLDTDAWEYGDFDIIINFGLLYHLEKFHKQFLINCIKHTKHMLLESVIFDSFDDEIYFRYEKGIDQSLTPVGGTPTTSFVENILKEEKTLFQKYDSAELNSYPHHYTWQDRNSKNHDEFARRFWKIQML